MDRGLVLRYTALQHGRVASNHNPKHAQESERRWCRYIRISAYTGHAGVAAAVPLVQQ